MLGYATEDLIGKLLWEVSAFKDWEASKSAFVELQKKGYIRYENLPLETKDGQSRQVEFVSNVYLVNGKKVIQCNIRDITERKHQWNHCARMRNAIGGFSRHSRRHTASRC